MMKVIGVDVNPNTRVMFLEFNELTPSLMERFIAEGHLPNFKRLHGESRVFVTDAQEEQWNLEPWIQWVTVHTGLSAEQHGIHNLDESYKLTKPSLWDLLCDAGYHVWICGSMNIKYTPPVHGWILPDPWSSNVAPYPYQLTKYFRFVRTSVQEHTNDQAPLRKSDYVAFLKFMLTHGLSMKTMSAIVSQIVKERRSGARWKRATLLDRLQWDLFEWYQRKHRPHLSTFFLNSTAHFQHLYWRHLEPEKFRLKEDQPIEGDHDQAILYGYRQMDLIVARALEMAGTDTIVILGSALGQQPYLLAEEKGGKRFHRPNDLSKFADQVHLKGSTGIASVMAEQFHISFDSAESAGKAAEDLRGASVENQPAFNIDHVPGGKALLAGCAVFQSVADNARLLMPNGDSFRFHDIFYLVKEGLKSGMHHPHGILWVRGLDRKHSVSSDIVPLRSVCPTILEMFGVSPTSDMTEPLQLNATAATVGSQPIRA
jgi:predicted AlkP superfamily phosphohydrolase/phosphomutase